MIDTARTMSTTSGPDHSRHEGADGILTMSIPHPAHKSRKQTDEAKSKYRSVRFASEVDVKEVPHLNNVPEDEHVATWYSVEDFDEMKKDMIATVRLMITNKPVGEDRCTRGLEFRTPAGARLRKQTKLEALTAVWNEQVSQWKRHETDEERISIVYQRLSYKSREAAHTMGLRDEIAVEPQEEERILKENSSKSCIWICKGLSGEDNFYKENATKPILKKHSCGPAAA